MIRIALKMMLERRARFVVTVIGIAALFFLSSSQFGLLVGWCNTTSAIIRHADADVWIMARETPAFDYGTAIPEIRLYQARNIRGVARTDAMFMAWNTWQRPDGRRVNVELVGLDDSYIGGPWRMRSGRISALSQPDGVIIDQLFLDVLGVSGEGAEAEMYGRRAIVRGVSEDVRTFTASPFVFTTIDRARRYDKRYSDDEITYVLVQCEPGHSPETVRDRLRASLPYVDCLTSGEFMLKTMKYWMLETGIGLTVVITAVLGFLVSAVVMSQTLYALTQDYLMNYATLLAIGFSRVKVVGAVILQSLILGSLGVGLGCVGFFYAARLSARTPIPLETTPTIFGILVLVALLVCVVAAFLSIRSVLHVDPGLVFRA